MQQPNVRTTLKDQNTGATYHVLAYRELSRTELLQCVAQYLARGKSKKPKPGAAITIVTIIGHDE